MKSYFSLVKFSHTIFALPFALLGFFIGVEQSGSSFDLNVLLLVILCMVFGRNAAMAFNRYIDREIDSKNPRTVSRELPAGILQPNAVRLFVLFNVFAFITTCYFINTLCFYLSPIALLIILGYSFTKRFTAFCHLVLGIGLSLAPVGAYLAVTAQFDLIPILLGLVVLFWVAGFDIIYAIQDKGLDESLELFSTPVWLGERRALWLSSLFHFLSSVILIYLGSLMTIEFVDIGILYWIATGVFILLLVYQHLIVSVEDMSRVNLAFFTTNGVGSVIFGALVIIDLLT